MISMYFFSSHSWADHLVPLLESSQTKLSDRVSAHNAAEPVQHDKLEPAAHLDPGPRGYDVYGPIGFSLHMVPEALLDGDLVAQRLKLQEGVVDKAQLRCQQVLMTCRRLFQRYAAGVKQLGGMAVGGGAVILDEILPEFEMGTVDVRALVKPQFPLLVAAYDKALRLIQTSLDDSKDLVVQVHNEMGDIMMLAGNVR